MCFDPSCGGGDRKTERPKKKHATLWQLNSVWLNTKRPKNYNNKTIFVFGRLNSNRFMHIFSQYMIWSSLTYVLAFLKKKKMQKEETNRREKKCDFHFKLLI